MLSDFFSILFYVLIILNFLFAVFVVFYERKNPAVTWSWLMVLTLIPCFGFMIYLVFGFEGRKHTKFSVKAKDDEILLDEYLKSNIPAIQKQIKFLSQKNILKQAGTEHLNDIVFLNLISSKSSFTKNNSLQLFHEGNSKFKKLLADISEAKEYIHMQYYIVRNDDIGNEIINALAKKAREGVEVKFLYDGMGNVTNSKNFCKPLIEAGGNIGIFLPPYFIRINFRNHRKICVIDGKIGYVGGLNIGDEYLGRVKRFGFWRDSHIRIVGDSIKELELRFIADWNFTSKDNKLSIQPKYFPDVDKQPKEIPMQILSSGPDTKWNNIQYGYFKMITEADKNIFIQTPYFVPDDSIFEALRIAALSGIDVRIMIPAHPDHPFVYWSSLSYLGELLEAGVKCYKYEKGFIHSKLITMDGLITSIGTANMDIRSFKLNFEVNAFIYDKNVTSEFNKEFIKDLNDCTEITLNWYNNRPRLTRLKEAISRLISPML